jgi:preprotein translocase subunit Sss1
MLFEGHKVLAFVSALAVIIGVTASAIPVTVVGIIGFVISLHGEYRK